MNKKYKLIYRFANFLIKMGKKLHIYIGYGVYNIPKYHREGVPLSVKEYTGDKKMFKLMNKNG